MTSEEEIRQKHKQEKKDLHSKIQSLKRSVPKGDKKKKKEVTEQIAQLEQELEDRQNKELLPFKANSESDESKVEEIPNLEVENNDISIENDEKPETEIKVTRISRAQKRREKKALEEAEREKRILEEKEKSKDGPKAVESHLIKEVLKTMGLALYDVAADGNCLYCAVNHQLESKKRESYSTTKLRKLTANFMKENKDDFIPFMYKDSGEPVSETYFEEYCKEVASTKLWGGQLELKALSNILKCPIKVIQANGPPTVLGEDFNGPELILTYHRHLYSLGEHYNSTIELSE
ncbi:deubiquitinase OTUD6B [Harmonia axyridis]|uniref:deubiquitinase OTUD6B n=1 Tax=Harmonia axyridis TaxID=115357 RepID=UPI001E278452|nr:deubiquitinase OTUD6B [Harmonia axyridis]